MRNCRKAIGIEFLYTKEVKGKKMKMLTKAILNKLPSLQAQDGKGDAAVAYVKFFSIRSDHRWFATEYDPETETFFGLVTNNGQAEWGYFLLSELTSMRWAGVPVVERDLHFTPTAIGEIRRAYCQ
jgi:hypothetical protein